MNRYLLLFLFAMIILIPNHLPAQVIEEIYAVVNDEVITLSDLIQFENSMMADLESRLNGDELIKAKEELKKNLMDLLINQKLIQSKLKEKNYNIDGEFEAWLGDLKKQNNIKSDEELKEALRNQGLEYSKWKEQMKEAHKINRLKYEEIGAKIKIDNSEIMDYYKKNSAQYTTLEENTLNALYLKKEEGKETAEIRKKLSTEINKGNFTEMAKTYSQLPDAATTPMLGKFKKGELAKELETEAQKLKTGEISSWIKTENGWYLLQLSERVEARLKEFRDVRDEIENTIRDQLGNEKMKDYIEQLKKESYIRIIKKYPAE